MNSNFNVSVNIGGLEENQEWYAAVLKTGIDALLFCIENWQFILVIGGIDVLFLVIIVCICCFRR